ncbi:EamA family transporter [Gemmobacter sp.]|uniref:EamA family transporter n=1 Tax=Gemmobacter sp. TaxID=1898957 RepID=UPI002AFDDF0F|nr:EamA family transporter [Gemmobacter sp.]
MTALLLSLEGTDAGRQAALWLALLAAFSHALLGALQKGRFDPWLMRGGIDLAYAVMALPFALFVVPWPDPHMWPILAGAFLIHAGYKTAQAATYARGAYTVVYPVVRGTGPLVTVLGAGLVFGETFAPGQWLGLGVLLAGIFGLALYNLRHVTENRDTLVPALGLAVLTGGFVAAYTTYDAWAIRQPPDPFTFLAWFFLLDGTLMPLLMRRRLAALPHADRWPFAKKAVLGALVAYISFGSILIATRIGNVGEAAVLRETSTVFAAAIGWLMLDETTGPRRVALMGLIAAGAVMVKLAG